VAPIATPLSALVREREPCCYNGSMKPRLAEKLAALRADLNCGHFILADAKDADMAWGATSAGPLTSLPAAFPSDSLPVPSPFAGRAGEGGRRAEDSAIAQRHARSRYRSIADFRDQIREIVRQGAVDIMLASASTMSVLTHRERLFDSTDVTPAIRANDASDIWLPRGGRYREEPSRPFATCFIEEVQYGSNIPARLPESEPIVNLGLYSVTFNNRLDADHATLTAFREFRAEAERCGFHYFLEVFAPNVEGAVPNDIVADFVNDHICRMLAGVPVGARPQFLKIPYFGPAALEELVAYDPSMIVGVLGGGSGTTYDAFKLLAEARKHGARAALFGRKIKDAEHPLTMVALLRRLADGQITPEDAVRAYHDQLQKQRIQPKRTLEEDSQLTACELAYAK
jgi:DhnA family fructose-bisphosphate aldolase class Ia